MTEHVPFGSWHIVCGWSDDVPMQASRETVTELTEDIGGVWWVHTTSGTLYVWNLDHGTVLRTPSVQSRRMRLDGEHRELAAVTRYPKVGESFVAVFPHPDHPQRGVVTTSSVVTRIASGALPTGQANP